MLKLAAALAAIAVIAVGGGTSQAADGGANGRIVFTAAVGKHSQLFSVLPDGSGLAQLTHFSDSDSLNANWSPDGRRITFERDFANHAGVYVMNADGSGVKALTPTGFQGSSTFTPDGTHIVYNRTEPHDDALWVMTAAGGGLRRIAGDPTGKDGYPWHEHPDVSPDGKRIAFTLKPQANRNALFVVGMDGSGLKQLTPYSGGVDGRVDWAPDGSRILFSSPRIGTRKGASANVFTIRPDGTGLTRLTHDTGGRINAGAQSWSPDGRQIAFVSNRADGRIYQLYVMNADGTGVTQVTHGPEVRGGNWGTARE